MRFGVGRRPDPIIDVTPMIDIVFQLVLFFMVTTTFVTAPGIDVDLPRSNADTSLSDASSIDLWITTEGAVYLDDAPVDLPSLKRLLASHAQSDPNTMVIMKADEGVSHGRVVTLMDLARSQGLSKLAIATEPPE